MGAMLSNNNGSYASKHVTPDTNGLGEYSDRELVAELVVRGVIAKIITPIQIRVQRSDDYEPVDQRVYLENNLKSKQLSIVNHILRGEK